MFFRSLPSAIFLFASITNSQVRVSVKSRSLAHWTADCGKGKYSACDNYESHSNYCRGACEFRCLCCISLDPGSKGEWIEAGRAV